MKPTLSRTYTPHPPSFPPPAVEFDKSVSDCFQSYMVNYVELERTNMKDIIDKFRYIYYSLLLINLVL
jgi:hypothetical protein